MCVNPFVLCIQIYITIIQVIFKTITAAVITFIDEILIHIRHTKVVKLIIEISHRLAELIFTVNIESDCTHTANQIVDVLLHKFADLNELYTKIYKDYEEVQENLIARTESYEGNYRFFVELAELTEWNERYDTRLSLIKNYMRQFKRICPDADGDLFFINANKMLNVSIKRGRLLEDFLDHMYSILFGVYGPNIEFDETVY